MYTASHQAESIYGQALNVGGLPSWPHGFSKVLVGFY